MPPNALSESNSQYVEMRDEARRWVDAPPGQTLHVRNRNQHLPVKGVRDVSARGISLIIDGRLEAGEAVLIESDNGATLIEYCAFVVWCRSLRVAEYEQHPPLHCPSIVGLRVYGPRSPGNLLM
jgi:hypothetical protein